ncbi:MULTISPECIES: hypothetical protein [unclassified Pseudomonas]|uniref:hypothetical protein n=1 Tax=unclassified Pseudomonas TaxID=196821 RepID=UPI00244B959E|nr:MULTISPECIES: hypothetical protein [unclassified Pseudomonas]MDG9925465.1 hypothetical protein [Pseudomonas sp. GD04045]MDH0034094.1 hypothetical protein [Pseudomonas sp. GD04019]
MELTTQQIYALFAIALCVALLIGLTYCLALKTGRDAGHEQGRAAAEDYWQNLLQAKRDRLIDALRQLDTLTRELTTLRRNSTAESDEHENQLRQLREQMAFAENDRENVIRDLLAALQEETSKRLTTADWHTLQAAAKQLGTAAYQFTRSGSTKTNQAAVAQANINALAARVKAILDQPERTCSMADSPITDTDLIEWLHDEAHFFCDGEHGEFRFQLLGAVDSDSHARDLLRKAMEDSDQLAHNHAESLRSALAPTNHDQARPRMWAAVDLDHAEQGLGQPLCL